MRAWLLSMKDLLKEEMSGKCLEIQNCTKMIYLGALTAWFLYLAAAGLGLGLVPASFLCLDPDVVALFSVEEDL